MAQRQTSLGFASDPAAALTTGMVNDPLNPAGTMPTSDPNAWDDFAPSMPDRRAETTQADPYGVANARKPLIDASKNPLQAIGAILMNVSNGMRGQPLYTDQLREQEQEAEMLGLKKLDLTTGLWGKAMELAKNTPDAATRTQVMGQFATMYEPILGTAFGDTVRSMATRPDNSKALVERFGKRGQEMYKLAGGDYTKTLELLQDDQLQGRLDKYDDQRLISELQPRIAGAMELLQQAPGGGAILEHMKNGWTSADMRDPIFQEATHITGDMVDALDRDPKAQDQLRAYGFKPASDLKAAAEAQIKADHRKPDKPANAQLLTAWNPETKQILSENVLYDPESASLRTASGQPLPPGFVAQNGGIPTSSDDMGAVTQGTDANGNPVFFRVPKGGTEAQVVEGVTPPPKVQLGAKQLENARGKLQSASLARVQLQQIKDKWLAIKDTAFSAGPGAGRIPTEAGKAFDKAVDAFRQTNRILTRTPGEGSMSDFETRLAQLALPNRGEWESVTEQSIQQFDDMLDVIESGYTSLLKDATPQPPKNGDDKPAATLPDAAQKQLEEGKVKTFGNGQSWTLRGGKPVKVN